jgi:hypothetical protein
VGAFLKGSQARLHGFQIQLNLPSRAAGIKRKNLGNLSLQSLGETDKSGWSSRGAERRTNPFSDKMRLLAALAMEGLSVSIGERFPYLIQ